MSTSVTLERFVGAPTYVHAQGAVVFYEASYARDQVIPCHLHEEAVISLVIAGNGVEEVGSRKRPLSAQDILFTPSHVPHGYRFAEDGRWFNVQLSDSWLERAADGLRPLSEEAQIVSGNTASVWLARVRSEVRLRDRVSGLAIDGALALMVADLARMREDSAPVRPRWLRRVEEAIDSSYASPPSVEQLAALAGVHPRHLLRTFRRHHGTTVAQYVRGRQLQQARLALANSTHPVSMVALDAGFADQSHFTRAFRHAYGETPAQYARSLHGR